MWNQLANVRASAPLRRRLARFPGFRLAGVILLVGPVLVYAGQLTAIRFLEMLYTILGIVCLGVGLAGVILWTILPTRQRGRQASIAFLIVLVTVGSLLLALQEDGSIFAATIVGTGLAVLMAWYQPWLTTEAVHPASSGRAKGKLQGRHRQRRQ